MTEEADMSDTMKRLVRLHVGYTMTIGDLEWLAWYVSQCAAARELAPETHELAAWRIETAIERKQMTRAKRAATARRKREAAGRPEPKRRGLGRYAYAP